MGILASLLGRMGYTKLGAYGLVQTPEGRIAMAHPRVLDDGFGGRIVGWRPEDTAPLELTPLELVPRAAAATIATARADALPFAPSLVVRSSSRLTVEADPANRPSQKSS